VRPLWHDGVRMRGVAVILSVLALSASADGATGSGVYGRISRGPVTPVCVAERPCSVSAAGTTLEFVRSGVVVARVVTAKDGTYRARLDAGVYLVRSAQSAGIGSRIDPTSVRVVAGRWAHQNFSIDTGIR
jgi:hypothetical protein